MKKIKQIYKNVLDIRSWARQLIEKILNSYITYHLRPKSFLDIGLKADTLKTYPKVAIIIQGPLLKEDKFTLNTIKIYKKIFGNCQIILSTWTGEDNDYLNEIRSEKIKIILNEKPKYPGIANINFQIASTRSAVKMAEDLKVNYILKTRTDLRIYNQNSFEFLVNLLKVFPVQNTGLQNKRIAIPSLNTFKYRPYSITDLVMFGTTDDMVKYWDIKFEDKKILPNQNVSIGEWSKARLAEVYLSASYLEKIGVELKWTLADSWKAYANNFCVFDSQSLNIYWHKYYRDKEYRRLGYGEMRNDQELTFAEWLNLYSGLDNKGIIPEQILHANFAEKINGEI